MKTHTLLNIISIALLLIAFYGFKVYDWTYDDLGYNIQLKQIAKGKSVDESFEHSRKILKITRAAIQIVQVLFFAGAFVLSIISVCKQSSVLGITLIIVLSICALLIIVPKFVYLLLIPGFPIFAVIFAFLLAIGLSFGFKNHSTKQKEKTEISLPTEQKPDTEQKSENIRSSIENE